MSKYDNPTKHAWRQRAFKASTKSLVDRGQPIEDARAIVLVDPRENHELDIEVLESEGWIRRNIWACAWRWVGPSSLELYRGVNRVCGDLAAAMTKSEVPSFNLLHLDFCKPLPNERDESHFGVFWNAISRGKLLQPSSIIINFNLRAYFNNDLYRDFLLAYVRRSYSMPEGKGAGAIDMRTVPWVYDPDTGTRSSTPLYFGPGLFSPERDFRGDKEYFAQQAFILVEFMRLFFNDLGCSLAVATTWFRTLGQHTANALLAKLKEKPPADCSNQ